MKIAYVNAEDLSKIGGGRVHFRAVAEELVNLGNSLHIVAPKYSSKPWADFDIQKIGKVSFRVPSKNVFGLFCFELLLFFTLPALKFKYRWDAILVRGGGPAIMMWMVFLWARILGMRVVLECNGVSWHEFKSRSFSKVFCKYIKFSAWNQAKTASSIIGVTPAICKAYCKLAKRPIADSVPISNGVFTEKFPIDQREVIRKEYGWDGKTVFIMPSGFSPWHALTELIDAITLLSPELRNNIRFVLPGDGEMFAEIKERITKNELDECVELPGQLGREDIYRVLSAADVGILLRPEVDKAKCPGSPLKLFEYFGAGLPVITCADSYHSKLIPFYSLGVVLEAVTPELLAEAIKTMTDGSAQTFDRQEILNVARNEFHWQKVAERVLVVLSGEKPTLEKWLVQGPI